MKPIAALILSLAGAASFANLVENGSFELDHPGPGWVGDVYTTNTPTGWTNVAGVVGTWRPVNYHGLAFNPNNLPRDGVNAGYTGNDGQQPNEMQQYIQGYTIHAGDTLHWSYSAGERIDNAGANDAEVFLYAVNGNGDKTQLSGQVYTGASGNWDDFSVDINSSVLQYYAGQKVLISLQSKPGKQGSYDNFVLTATPEPGTMAALALGAIAFVKRKRSK